MPVRLPLGAGPESRGTQTVLRFGRFEVNLDSATLRRSGSPVRMQAQAFRALVLLLEHAGEIVTREELCERLWPTRPPVELDRNLNTALRKVRQALHDSPVRPRYLETIRGRGYRFRASVERTTLRRTTRSAPSVPRVSRKGDIWRAVLALLAAVGRRFRPGTGPR